MYNFNYWNIYIVDPDFNLYIILLTTWFLANYSFL